MQILEAWIWRLKAWMLDAGRIGARGLLDGRRGLEEIPTCSSFSSSVDLEGVNPGLPET